MPIKRIFTILTVCFVAISTGIFVYIFLDDYMFGNDISILINILKCCAILCFISVIVLVVLSINSTKSIGIKRLVAFFLSITIILCSVFSVSAYKDCKIFFQSCNSSSLREEYTASVETKKLLPYYDYFYQLGSDEAEYAIIMMKNNLCTEISVSNNLYLKVNSASYRAEYIESKAITLLIKSRLNLMRDLIEDGFSKIDDSSLSCGDIKYEVYGNGHDYTVVIKDSLYIFYATFSNVIEDDVSLYSFVNVALEQHRLLNELKSQEVLTDADYLKEHKGTVD